MKKTFFILILLSSLCLIPVANAIAPADPCDTPGQGGAKYWFFMEEPCYAFYDPEVGPNYVGSSSDDWVTDSVIKSIDWESFVGDDGYIEFNFWLVVTNSDSHNTKVVISINNAAASGISEIWVDTTEITSWTSSVHSILSPHGVFNSAEFYGYYEYDIGTLNQTDKGGSNPVCAPIQLHFKVKLNEEATNDIKIHLDAYGCEGAGPYSHDATILHWPDIPTLVVPEILFGTAAVLVTSLIALMLSKRRLF